MRIILMLANGASYAEIQEQLETAATTISRGKFQFRGLSPGEYRVLAVTEANKDKLNEPVVLDRLLPAAEKITLDRGGVQDLHLKLTDPSR